MSGRDSRFWVVGAADATFEESGQHILAGGRVVGRDGRPRLAVPLDLGTEQTRSSSLTIESVAVVEPVSEPKPRRRQAARSAAMS
jgi:hypothetical protein